MIQINPLKSYIDGGVRAAITTPPSASLVFDLPGKAIWVKGVKLKGTDHTYTFSHDNYITLTNTPDSNESEDIKIGVNTSALKSAIDTTYGVVSTTANGLAPKFTSENKQAASTATTYYFLGWAGTTLKWYQVPFRNVRINSETTDRLGVNSTDPLIISSGNGISVTWDSTNKKIVITNTKPDVNHNTHYTTMLYIGENNDTKANKNVANPYLKLFDDNTRRATFQIKAGSGIAVASDTNGNITITNSSPDVNHNTDRTGIKLATVSGTKKTDSTLILANSTTGLNIQGGTNKFLIGDGTNYIEVPVTPYFTVSNKDATIGTSLTTIATIAGVDIKAKIASYSLSNHTHSVKINGSTKTITSSGAVDLGNYLPLSGGTMGGTAWIRWPDSGNISNNNEGVTFPVIRGGLEWRGQTDYIKLFSEETGRDNLNLVLQFGDDNSNGLSIRNASNVQTSYISAGGVITTGTFKGNLDWSYITNKPATATRWPSWGEVTGKPSSFTPSTHTHGLSNSVFFLNMPRVSGNAKWKEVFGYPVNYNLLLSVRISSPAPEWCVGNYGSGILYGGSDTKGFMSSAHNEPLIMWAGGNGSSDDSVPKWYIGIKGIHKSIYNLATIASEANTAYNLRHSHANKSVLDGITSGLVNNWNTAYTFVNTISGTDTDKIINKWDEIVNFLTGISEDDKLNTLLNSKLSVYKLADNTNVGAIKNNGIYYSISDSSSGTLLNSPFSTSFTLINMTSYDGGDDLRRSRLAFNAFGEIKVSNDRGQANTTETWYNVLTSKNSGISGSTIKLNGTSITVYSSSTADGRYVKKTGDTMSGALTIDTTGFGALIIKRNDDANGASIQFRGKSNIYGYIGLNNDTKDKQFLRWNSDNTKVYTILDTSSTYVSSGKGIINGTTITQVDNATNATNSTNARKLVNWYSTRPTSLNIQFGDGSLRIFHATSSTTEGKSPDDAAILHLSWDNNGRWDTQLGISTHSGRVYSRSQNNGTWQPWKTLAFTTDIPTVTNYYWADQKISNNSNTTTNPTVALLKATTGVQIGSTADYGWYLYNNRICAGINVARDINTGSLLVSSAWADSSKVPTNGIYSKGNIQTAGGFIKSGSSNSYILLGAGGHKAISDFATSGHNHNNSYVASVSISGNNLRINKNGVNTDLTIPYATNTDKVDGYHANTVYNAPSFMVYNGNTSNTYILLATITISGTSLACAEFTTLFQNRECLDSSSFILSGAIRRNSTTSVGASLSYITLHTEAPRNIYMRSDDGVTFRIYIQSLANNWTTYYRAIPIVDSGNITYSNTGTTSPISGSVLNITAIKGGNVNYANSAGSAQTATIASKLGTSTVGATNVPIYLNSGTPTVVNLNSTANNLINNLSVGDSVPTDNDYYISQYVGGGTTTTSYHRRPHSALYNYIKNKAEGTWNISINGNAKGLSNNGVLDSQEKINNFLTANRLEYAPFKTTESNNVGLHDNDGMILSIPWSSTSYGAQIAFDDATSGTVKVRGKNNSWGNWYTLLHSGNSNVSGGGNMWGSSITVNINGTSKTLTIPGNPNTDYRVTQSETTTANYRPLVVGYTNVSTAGSGMTGSVTNQVYLSNKFYVQPSTGNLYATNFVGALSGNASSATKLQTPRTIWGQSFNGTSNVSGSISGTYFHIEDRVSNPYFRFIDSSNQIGYFQLLPQNKGVAIGSIESKSLIVNPSGNVGIGITSPTYKLHVAGDIYTTTGFKKNGSSDSYVLLGGGGHKAISDFMLKTDELSNNLTTISKSLTVTQAWMDTGIKYTDLPANGTYIIQVYANNTADYIWSNYWSGIMSWYRDGTNDSETDEIILHRAGHAYHHTIYLRTIMTTSSDGRHLRLQIAADTNLSTAVTYTFKFKRVI